MFGNLVRGMLTTGRCTSSLFCGGDPVSAMKTILFADDHRNIREYCRAALAEEGYRVVLARDGIEAMEMFLTETPDLAILDISMPRSNGLETLEQIKSHSPRTPVILFTAHDDECLRDRRAMLAAACVAKDKDLAELKHIVDRTLRRRGFEGGEPLRTGLPPFQTPVEHA
jgi:DNA-binding response OmpR family regulator